MTVWGIGAFYKCVPSKNVTQQFIDNNCACIGWEEVDAPILYEVFKAVQVDDYIYIKAYSWRYKRLTIKAVGKVIDNAIKERAPELDLGRGVLVEWVKSFKPDFIDFKDKPQYIRYNVYANTLYQEYNPNIIKLVKNAVDNL